ncbi:MAG: hypothetical protein ABIW34_03180 [Ginsengibacter sp.]
MDEIAALDLKNSLILPQISSSKATKKHLFFIFSYLIVVPVFIGFLMLYSLYFKYEDNRYISRQAHKPQYQALPSQTNISGVTLEKEDARIQALDEFFAQYKSPLEGYGKKIVDEADKNNIDYRLLPAIAMQESTLCKKIIKNSFNCWGFGIYGGKVTRFENYDEAIRIITSTLSKKYVQKGFVKIDDIVTKYTPSDTGKWAGVVNMIMNRLKASI